MFLCSKAETAVVSKSCRQAGQKDRPTGGQRRPSDSMTGQESEVIKKYDDQKGLTGKEGG